MNYIGSKKSLLQFLETSIKKVVGEEQGTFLDLFAGTGIVGRHFKKLGYRIISNDLQYYSYVLNQNYIGNNDILFFNGLEDIISNFSALAVGQRAGAVCQYLEDIEGIEGFIYQNYCWGGSEGSEFPRRYFSDANGQKTDAIRICIEQWRQSERLTMGEYWFLLASVLESIDKVANTASVYGAFLKKLKKTAQNLLKLEPAYFYIGGSRRQEVYNEDILTLIDKVEGDILYLDPPYNHRQYAPNYHILETIARYDNPRIRGVTGLRDYSLQKSKFAQKREVEAALSELVQKAKVRYIFLSYNNEGLLDPDTIANILSQRGEYGLFSCEYPRFKADTNDNRKHKAEVVQEYLHYVRCR